MAPSRRGTPGCCRPGAPVAVESDQGRQRRIRGHRPLKLEGRRVLELPARPWGDPAAATLLPAASSLLPRLVRNRALELLAQDFWDDREAPGQSREHDHVANQCCQLGAGHRASACGGANDVRPSGENEVTVATAPAK